MPNVFLLIIVFIISFFPIYLSEESSKNDTTNLRSIKDCSKCRILTISFSHWLDKTARGKHEGGDAAWEETKLRNYAHSEMRLVEIQEKLCSDLKLKSQDQCYAFAEETESSIEKWWYLENSRSSDLFSWLCVNELQLCCPKHHFGDQCHSCLVNSKNEICSGHGKCDGEGTRKGNGSCICDIGYDGDLCDKCKINYFNNKITNNCEPCHKSCDECNESGASACLKCASGWTLEMNKCVDIDECFGNWVCRRNEYCINTEGSYVCKPCHKNCDTCTGIGSSNCSSCYSNDILWSGKCLNEDELLQNLYRIFLRAVFFCAALFLSIMMFRKYICVTSIFLLSSSALYFYFETYYEEGLLHALLYNLFEEVPE